MEPETDEERDQEEAEEQEAEEEAVRQQPVGTPHVLKTTEEGKVVGSWVVYSGRGGSEKKESGTDC